MSFKQYLREAEWVQGQRYPSTEALWHVLQPLVTSKQHLLALGSESVYDEPPQKPREQGSRMHPTHGGTLDPNTKAIGIRQFMNHGLTSFGRTGDKEILHILRVNLQDVWTIDPKINEKNPFLIMKTHWADLQKEFQRLSTLRRTRIDRNTQGNYQSSISEWGAIAKRIENWYKGLVMLPDDNPDSRENFIHRLQYLFHLIYVEAPRILNYIKTGYTANSRGGIASNFVDTHPGPLGPESWDMHVPKELKMDFKIISQTLPLTDTPWAIILDPRVAKTENTVVIPANFQGFRQADADPNNQYAKAFYAPNAKNDRVQGFADDLEARFRDDLVPELNHFLEYMGDAAGDEGGMNMLRKRAKNCITAIKTTEKILWRIEKIHPEFKLPKNLQDAIQEFKTHGEQILAEIEEDDEDDYDQFNTDKDTDKEKIREIFLAVSNALSNLWSPNSTGRYIRPRP